MKNVDTHIEPDVSELFLERLDEIEEAIADKVVAKLQLSSNAKNGSKRQEALKKDDLDNFGNARFEKKMFDPIAGP
jgi:hypothetical protein